MLYTLRRGYKYIPAQYAKTMISEGSLRIGTLFQYRKQENLQIVDSWEGIGWNNGLIPEGTFSNETMPWIMKGAFTLSGNVSIETTGSVMHDIALEVQDAYIYCITMFPEKIMMSKFDADACVEIRDIIEFAAFVGAHLYSLRLTQTPYPAIQDCIYNDRQLFATSEPEMNSIYWLKHERYELQREIRIVFFANPTHQILPLNVIVPEIKRCVRYYEFP